VPDILQRHLELLVARHRIRKDADFQRVEEIYSPAFYEDLRKRLLRLPSVRDVRVKRHDYSCVDCVLAIRYRGNTTWGVSIEFSTISPFYNFRYMTPLSDVRIDADLVQKLGRQRLSVWLRRKPHIPAKVVRQTEALLSELPAFGLVHVTEEHLSMVPRRSPRLPKEFCSHRFGFFFFDSVPFFE
jgi:hypothetical protein